MAVAVDAVAGAAGAPPLRPPSRTPLADARRTVPPRQGGFETSRAWARALARVSLLNTGGGWLELKRVGADAFLSRWWRAGREVAGGLYLYRDYREQALLGQLLAADPRERRAITPASPSAAGDENMRMGGTAIFGGPAGLRRCCWRTGCSTLRGVCA